MTQLIPTSSRSDHGFTLVELLVAMVIVLVALLGLLQSVGIITETNLRNQMRDEAVQIGDKEMNSLMSISDSSKLPYVFANMSVRSNLRGVNKKYRVSRATRDAGTLSREIGVRVVWTYKNSSTSHTVSSIKTFP